MLTLDRNATCTTSSTPATSATPELARTAAPPTPTGIRQAPPQTARDRRVIAALVAPRAVCTGRAESTIDVPSIDATVRHWIPRLVPLLGVLISGSILAIWSIL
jgi:hypothetical protein